MRKITTLFVAVISILFMSCGNETTENINELNVNDTLNLELKIDSMSIDTSGIVLSEDSVMEKISSLMKSTENSHTKVKEIKAIKKENVSLKKELVETKAELKQIKAELSDTLIEPTKKKKKSFLQKVISSIKKDSI
jgi:septal ring factor EnvC (AmiA/AmiB activator)